MGDVLARYTKAKQKVEADERRSDLPRTDRIPPNEAKALRILRKEAAEQGTTLASGGKGGLPSSMVLGCLRKCDYRCTRCGSRKMITIHHKGGVVESKWLSRQGHKTTQANLTALCTKCHDTIHEEARAEGKDSSQVTPVGDVGDPRRDHGKPVDPG
jgi:5-methylcytosine-specific restriction endonuclease McrA